MDTGRVRFLAVFVVFLCVFAAHNSEGNRKLAQSFSDNGDSWDYMNTDDDTVKQIWTYCSNELKDSTELNSDLTQTLNSYDGIEEFDSSLPVKRIIKKAIANLPPKKKDAILDCLREKTLASQILRVEEETWLDKYQNIVFDWVNVPRRILRRKRRHHRHHLVSRTAPAPNRAPGPGVGPRPVPGTAPALAPALFVASSVSLITTHLVSAPSPSPVLQLAPYPVPQPPTGAPESSTPPQDYINAPSPSDNNGPSILREPFSDTPMENSDTNKIYMIAAIVTAVVAGITIAALLLLLCRKRNGSKVEPKDGLRDEKHLLNFSASDISAGSSQKTQGIGNASIKAPSTITENDSTKAKSQKSESDTESSDKTNNSNLPLPPGRTTPPSPPPEPPPPPPKPAAPAPPPPPIVSRPPPPNPPRPSTLGPHHRGRSSMGEPIQTSDESEVPKTKLKPFFWDKVLASPNHSMVWHEIKAGSFQVDEEMMENLFGYALPYKNKNGHNKDLSAFEAPRLIQIIDPKKSQNLAILLRALNVTTEEVCDALREGNELPAELIHTLIKMSPTSEEELKLRLYNGDVSHIGPAERFLKVMVEIPFAFKRLESLLFISTYQEEVSSIKESHSTLEVACKELRNSRLFLKLLEAVLKTGNRMNDGTYRGGAQAFKIETLLKLSDVKGTDGKTTLLHFVVQEIIRSEGLRAARRLKESQSMSSVKTEDLIDDSTNDSEDYHRTLGLQVVAGLSNELENVKNAASIDHEILTASVSKLGQSLISTKGFLEKEMKVVEGENDFRDALASFVEHAECDIKTLIEEEKRIMALVKSTGDYFHGRAGKDESSRLFVIIRDFLLMLDKSCKDVKNSTKLLPAKTPKKETLTASCSQDSRDESSSPDYRQRLFPAIRERHVDDDFSSNDES